eukprot:scaffold95322_cov18-Tisochrysis_lutea.AAC.3
MALVPKHAYQMHAPALASVCQLILCHLLQLLWLYHDGACHSDPANGLGFLKTGAHLSAHRIPHSPHPFPGLSST